MWLKHLYPLFGYLSVTFHMFWFLSLLQLMCVPRNTLSSQFIYLILVLTVFFLLLMFFVCFCHIIFLCWCFLILQYASYITLKTNLVARSQTAFFFFVSCLMPYPETVICYHIQSWIFTIPVCTSGVW